ncbi:hypothetical protein D3C85_465280 [compost metagenome]
MFRNPNYLMFALFAALTLATTAQAADEISPQDFVDRASAAGIAEVEAGKLALEKGTNPKVKEFAQMMVDEHTAAGKELAAMAKAHKLELNDDATLTDQAKEKILEMRDGESFDRAYANNQVTAHNQAVALFVKAANSEDQTIRTFATQVLPKLEHHLELAKNLASEIGADQ